MKPETKFKLKSLGLAIVFAAAVAGTFLMQGQTAANGPMTAKASGAVVKGTFVKLSAAGTVATANLESDVVLGVCEMAAATTKITKVSGPGMMTTVTSGEAIAAGKRVMAGTGGKAYVWNSTNLSPRSVCGIALTAAAAADADLTILVLDGVSVPSTEVILSGGTPQAINETSATQNYALGSRRATADGRVFRYACAGAAGVCPGYGAFTQVTLPMAYEVLHDNATAGDTTVLVDQTGITANQWAGGYIVMGHAAQATTQNRLIVSNTASAASTNHVTVTLDQPLSVSLTTSHGFEVVPNIYSNVQVTTSEYSGVVGVPAAIATTGQYFWLQTWGPCWIVPGGPGTPGSSAQERTVYFVGDGSVNGEIGAIGTYTECTKRQSAGFIIQKDSAGVGGPPFVMLQISP